MNTILLQICKNFIGDVAGFFSDGSPRTFDELEKGLRKVSDGFVLEMISAYFDILDKTITEDKLGRKHRGLVIERKGDSREIYTKFGGFKYKRTYFEDKKNQSYVYLLDEAVGLPKYTKVSGSVAVDLVNYASEASYGRSSKYVSGGEISRQTVMNKVRDIKGLRIERPETKRQVKVLHVEADEDHVALQDGTNTIVPLISIHEGVERNGKRGRCKNIRHISDYGKSVEDLWLEAAQWIDEVYDVDNLERIYLHGDGAAWIKTGINWLPKSRLVLDKYHLNKAVLTATGSQPEFRKEIYTSISTGNLEHFKSVVKRLYKKATTLNEKKRINEFRFYVQNNWSGISIYSEENCSGSCTEGHVSHVLSSRLSSRPMGWSRKGLKVMAQLRAYCVSGGRVTEKHLTKGELSYRPSKTLLHKAAKVFKSFEKIDNVPLLSRGQDVPHYRHLKAMQVGLSLV